MGKPKLEIAWATGEAARYACERWHYSKCLPSGKLVRIGAWEDGEFIGVVLFGRGTSPYLGKAYALQQTECIELVRVALREHATPVSRIVAIALRMLKKANPGIRLVVSFAAQTEGHHGGIYQAGNWIYAGQTKDQDEYLFKGKRATDRTVAQFCVNTRTSKKEWERRGVLRKLPTKPKHRYLMPLDDEIRERVKPLSKPYPKREKQAMDESHSSQRRGSTDPLAPAN